MPSIRTRLRALLATERPILQAPMEWLARSALASAVSDTGGMQIIETSSGEFDAMRGPGMRPRTRLTR